jgi:IrrE N-terminal-like domain
VVNFASLQYHIDCNTMQSKYQKAKEKAAWLVEKYALPKVFSVFELAELMGIDAKQLPPQELWNIANSAEPEEVNDYEPNDILGYYDYKNNTVYVSNDQSLYRKRFTMAHEIGHQQLHRNQGKGQFRKIFTRKDAIDPTNALEVEANYFAGYLLVPDQLIIDTLPYTKIMLAGERMVSELSNLFGISKEATRIRLKTFKQENPDYWQEYDLSNRLF